MTDAVDHLQKAAEHLRAAADELDDDVPGARRRVNGLRSECNDIVGGLKALSADGGTFGDEDLYTDGGPAVDDGGGADAHDEAPDVPASAVDTFRTERSRCGAVVTTDHGPIVLVFPRRIDEDLFAAALSTAFDLVRAQTTFLRGPGVHPAPRVNAGADGPKYEPETDLDDWGEIR